MADILWLAQSPFRSEAEQPDHSLSRNARQEKADFVGAAGAEIDRQTPDKEQQPTLKPLPPEEDPLIPFFPATPAQARLSPEARLLPSELLPSSSEIPGLLPLQLPQSPLLQDRDALLRLLQPLMRPVPSRQRQWLDETATVEAYAETRLLSPVLRPALEPCFRVIVLLDAGISMRVWQPLAQELRNLLASSHAFAAVDLLRLDPSEELPIGGGWGDQTTLVLLLSDAAGAHWWDGRMFTQLEHWGRQAPVVLLNMLPFGWWARTALGIAAPVTLCNTLPACANQHYRAEPLSRWQRLDDPAGLPLPVITLEGQALAIWAGVAMGDSEMASTGILIPDAQERAKRLAEFLLPPQVPAVQEAADPDPAAARDLAVSRWQEFQADATAQAQRLLMVMAAAPVLTLPIIRLLLEAKVKDASTPLPMAEVLVSGLLRCRVAANPATPQHQLQFELEPGVAQLLAERLSPGDTLDVIRAVSDVLERRWNQLGTGTSFEAILSDPN
ncbi:MAG: SAV_2336 N-terminal domain-related protein, partial [Cyanobium sp.]